MAVGRVWRGRSVAGAERQTLLLRAKGMRGGYNEPVTVERIGRYVIQEVLGRGAMGVVYRAHDPIIDREVALKTLRLDIDSEMTEEFRERFFREARAAGRLSHPSIVTIHDVGEDESTGLVFIAMEMIRGRNLSGILQEGRHLRPSEAARVVYEVAAALDYAHSMGVVHRDIKPANVLITDGGKVKIADFGVARLESSNLTVEGQFVGTPNYMSPEQITGQSVDGRSDIFSLGVVLFELLTGIKPFAGKTMAEVTLNIVQKRCPIPSSLQPGLPVAFNPILLKCLNKEPDQRFQSGAELAEVLAALTRSLVEREPHDAAQPSVFEPDLSTKVTAPEDPVQAQNQHPSESEADPDADTRPSTPAVVTEKLVPLGESSVASPNAAPSSPRGAASGTPSSEEPAPGGELPFWRWEVEPAWAVRILAVWIALWMIIIGWLWLKRPGPTPAAPPAAATRTLTHTVLLLRQARRSLEAGDALNAEQIALQVLDQAPASPAARALLATARAQFQQADASARARAKTQRLVDEGRHLYRSGRYREAASQFEAALAIEPENDLASSFLELARESGRAQNRARIRPTPRTVRRARTGPAPTPTPGTARLTVYFNSPINAWTVTVTLGVETLGVIPFDFTEKGFLGRKKKGSGLVKRVFLLPSGRRTLGVQVTGTEEGPLGYRSFQKLFPGGTNWTLRIDMPSAQAHPQFFLVKASG